MKNIVIAGSGGFARETKWLIDRVNGCDKMWNFLGYISMETGQKDVIGGDNYIMDVQEELSVALAIGNPRIRQALYKRYKSNANIQFPNLIDTSVEISESVQLGYGNIICANNVLTVDINIGCFNIINLGCTVGHDVRIGDFNTVNPGSNISGNVVLKDFIEVGTGAKIIQGITVGEGGIIGAGSVVISDIPVETTVVGVPARIIKYHEKDR